MGLEFVMQMGMGHYQIMEQSVKMMIQTSDMLSLPVGALDNVADYVANNPESVNEFLLNSQIERKDPSKGVRAVYGKICDKKQNVAGGGIVMMPSKEDLEKIVGDFVTQNVPLTDVVYRARKGEKPQVFFADQSVSNNYYQNNEFASD